jgi:hypothetical protein
MPKRWEGCQIDRELRPGKVGTGELLGEKASGTAKIRVSEVCVPEVAFCKINIGKVASCEVRSVKFNRERWMSSLFWDCSFL